LKRKLNHNYKQLQQSRNEVVYPVKGFELILVIPLKIIVEVHNCFPDV